MDYDFKPVIWSEQPVPEDAENCSKCELSRQRTRMIWGEGNPEAAIIVILDNPGCKEDKEGNSFVCGTRQTLQLAALEAGLEEKDLFVTYVLKCRPLRKYDKETARGTCLKYLDRQLEGHPCKIVFCLGDVAVKAFFNDPEKSVKETRGIQHFIRGFTTFTSYHPLAVRRRPNLYSLFQSDWKTVAEFAVKQSIVCKH